MIDPEGLPQIMGRQNRWDADETMFEKMKIIDYVDVWFLMKEKTVNSLNKTELVL